VFSELQLVIAGLVTWRISIFLVKEDGPWMLGQKIRTMFGIEHDGDGVPVVYPTSMPGIAFACLWCTSLWIAPTALAMVMWLPLLAYVLALSAGAIIIDSLVSRDD